MPNPNASQFPDLPVSKTALTNSSGTEYNSSNPLPISATIETGDIEIGAVEIKNATDDTRAVVKTDGTNNALVVTTNVVVPGTAATNLGKAVDSVVGATDTGVAALVKRKDSLATLTPADGDYVTLQVDSQGSVWTHESGPLNLNATKTDDAAFAIGTDVVIPMGALADETTPDSVDEGDIGLLRMTLTRFLKTSLGDLISGEDQTNNLLQVIQKPTAVSTYTYTRDSSTALEASSISKASAGNLYRAFGVIDATAATDLYYIQFLDSATLTADGAVTHLITPIAVNHTTGTDSMFDSFEFPMGVAAANGIVIVASTTLVTKTIAGAIMFATTLFK